jgi:2-dehydro-3-deoxyphosphogluconate aldolase / (4S)-4-hydroxy-2-oxoglutarate aldolase
LVNYPSKVEVIRKIREGGIIPVIRADSSDVAIRAVTAIQSGGISVIEITMTVPGAIGVIAALANEVGKTSTIGAGTVRDRETAQACISAGAQFIVSPVLKFEVVELCVQQGVTVIPGTLTPTEVSEAWAAGADLVKVFPVETMGGASYIKTLHALLPEVLLVPTGGVSFRTAADFILAGAVALGVGTDLVDIAALRAGHDHLISDRARQFIQIVRESRAT